MYHREIDFILGPLPGDSKYFDTNCLPAPTVSPGETEMEDMLACGCFSESYSLSGEISKNNNNMLYTFVGKDGRNNSVKNMRCK